MWKKLSVIFSVILIFSLTSCTATGFNNTDTVRPPKATGERAEIQAVIEKTAGSDYTLKYPQNGEYRSAVVTYDLDNDSSEEALAFYSSNNDENAGVNLLVIDKTGDEYKSVAKFSVAAAEIDQINILDLDNDGYMEVVVGWSIYSSSVKKLTAYSFSGRAINEFICDENYNDLVTTDLNGDGIKEIVLLSLGTKEVSANAKILKIGDSGTSLYPSSTVIMNSDVVKYLNILPAKINNDKNGIILDGLFVDSSVQTQVLYLDESGSLLNPLFSPDDTKTTHNVNPLVRGSNILSYDINGDGITEIPVIGRLHTDTLKENETVCSVYDWCFMNSVTMTLEPVITVVTDPNASYWFSVPAAWKNKYTAIYNSQDSSITFKKHSSSDDISDNDTVIMRIRVFNETEWNKSSDGYTTIQKYDKNIYAYKFYLTEDDEMYLNTEQIKNNFFMHSN